MVFFLAIISTNPIPSLRFCCRCCLPSLKGMSESLVQASHTCLAQGSFCEWMSEQMAQAGIEIKRHLCVPFPHQTTGLQRVEMSPRAPCWEQGKDEVLRAAEGGWEFSSSNFLHYVVGETGEGAEATMAMAGRTTPWSAPGLLPHVYLLPLCQDLRRWTWRSLRSFLCSSFWCGYINKSFFSTFTIRNHWLNLPCWLAGLAISPLSTGPLRPPRKYMKNYLHKWGN